MALENGMSFMQSRNRRQWFFAAGMASVVGAVVGCAGRPQFVRNTDPALNRASTFFAADAAKRFPYKSDLPRGGTALARAQVGYQLDQFDIVNLSTESWTDVEVWVNQSYVINLPKMEPNTLKRVNFRMIYDATGNYFPLNNTNQDQRFSKMEIVLNGKMYDVPLQLGD